jgi:DNA-binding protein YbaB
MFDINSLLGRVTEIKARVNEIKSELSEVKVHHRDQEGLVEVTVRADKRLDAINITESGRALAAETLQVLLVSTINEALEKAQQAGKEKMKQRLAEEYPSVAGMDLSKFLD